MLVRAVCVLATMALVGAQPLPKLLEELLWKDPRQPIKPKEFDVAVPKQKADCSDMSVDEMLSIFMALVPEQYIDNEIILAGTEEIFSRLDYCQSQIDDEIYLNLRTAILSHVFLEKNVVLNVPWETQVKCLRAMEQEEHICDNYRQKICNYVNPVNGDAPEFSVQLVQELLQESQSLSQTQATCAGMVGIIKDQEALESAAPIDHDAVAVVDNGLALPFLEELNEAARSGYLAEVWGGYYDKNRK